MPPESRGKQVAFRQHGVISIGVEGLGAVDRDLSTIGRAGAKAHADLADSAMRVGKKFDENSRNSFRQLKDDMKSAQTEADKGMAKAKAALQATATLPPPEPTPDLEAKFPDVAKQQAMQLNAMKANMAEFRRSMAEAGVDVGDAATMQEDIGATMGGEVDERRKGQAILNDMLQKQQQLQKTLKDQSKEIANQVKQSKENLKKKDDEVKVAQNLRKEAKLKHGEDSKQFKAANANVKRLERERRNIKKVLKDEKKLQTSINQELQFTERRVESLIDDKGKQLNLDKALSAEESKRRRVETKAQQDYKKRESDNNKVRRQTNDLLRTRRDLSIQFNRQVEAMANSFKTTLVGALAVSTAATAAFFNKLDGVRQVFMAFEEELMNAQSIFQANQEVLFGLSDQIVDFGNQYGISMQDASQGLYTLASAGLDAEESMEVLGNTLKLSMAVQGDHETIAKLTTQTIFGFGLQMSDSAELTDKFAHAINKSLIEYQDLASAVKFAMPFFVSTGQNIDQLLGSLEILTNRALEAGIAGRGLRQALAEFAQHAQDNTAAFRKLGVEIMDSEGNFKMLTEIAKEFSDAMGPAASDVDLMTTLLEDLNVRGATAFVHLVQNADEFEHAVQDLANSSGAATEMADIQQQSLARSIQLIKNALQTPFIMSDEVGKQAGHLNEFSMTLHNITDELQGMFVVMENGVAIGLTPMGEMLKSFVIEALHELHDLIKVTVETLHEFSQEGADVTGMIRLMTVPLKAAVKILGLFTPKFFEILLIVKTLNSLLPIQNMLIAARVALLDKETVATMKKIFADNQLNFTMKGLGKTYSALALSQAGISITMFAMVALTEKYAKGNAALAGMIGAVAGAFMGAALAIQIYNAGVLSTLSGTKAFFVYAALIVTTMAAFAALNVKIQEMMAQTKANATDLMPEQFQSTDYAEGRLPIKDSGGMALPIYDGGATLGNLEVMNMAKHVPMGKTAQQVYAGRAQAIKAPFVSMDHQLAILQNGETVIPKTQNMLGARGIGIGPSGITINIQGNIMDGDDFVEKVSEALPRAFRMQTDNGGL